MKQEAKGLKSLPEKHFQAINSLTLSYMYNYTCMLVKCFYYFPLKRSVAFHLNKPGRLSPNNALCKV